METVTENGCAAYRKYLRVVPIFGLLIYYIGWLITSLDVPDQSVFLIQLIAFSTILILGLITRKKELVIVGAIISILGSVSPLMHFIQSLNQLSVIPILGSALLLVADILFVMTLFLWLKCS